MKTAKLITIGILLLSAFASAQSMPKPEEPRTIQNVLDHALTNVEKEFVSAADAMPEDKYDFAPTNGEFKGVRTYAQQIKHTAATTFELAAVILQEKPPVEVNDESGPDSVKTKAECMKYLKDSFAYLHKAIAIINEKNAVESLKSPWGQSTVTRLGLTTLTIGHCFDHYGQMVVYLRMNGIIPPASRM
jgi:DinB superfamily